MIDPLWLVLAFAAGSLMGATVMAIYDEIQRRKRAVEGLRLIESRPGDPVACMSGPRHEHGWRHLLRVRLGVHGARGTLFRRLKKDGSGWYWKVKLDRDPITGRTEWAWPDGAIQDGPGAFVSRCQECRMAFMSERRDEPVCPPCDEEMFGTAARRNEPSGPTLATRRYLREHSR